MAENPFPDMVTPLSEPAKKPSNQPPVRNIPKKMPKDPLGVIPGRGRKEKDY